MIAFEQFLQKNTPDWVVVGRAVHFTMACTMTVKKLGIRPGIVEILVGC